MSLFLLGFLGIILLLIFLLLFGMPVGFAMALVGFLGFGAVMGFNASMGMVSSTVWSVFSNYGLIIIPLFIFMGQIAFHTGVSEKMYTAADRFIGHIRGGMAMATVFACSAFSAICGSNSATAATMTAVALPEMNKYGYNSKLSTGVIACGSTLGVVIPPSVVLIIIGLYTNQSIVKLFYGGIGAGLLLTLMFAFTVFFICLKHPTWGPAGTRFSWKERGKALLDSSEILIIFIIVMLGLYFGFFTPVEAGAVGAFLVLAITFFQGKLNVKKLMAATVDTLIVSAMVMMIVAGAAILGKFLTVTRLPFEVASWVATLPVPKIFILVLILLVYAIGGMLMDALALLLITLPIFFPMAQVLGFNPIWFGITVTVVTTMGAVTPPIAATAYVVAGMAKPVPLVDVFRGVFYFLPAYLITIFLLLLFPKIVLFLPNLLQ